MPLPHFGGPSLSNRSCSDENLTLNIKTSQTVLRLKDTFSHFEVTKYSLQFFINCVEDLSLMGERVCLLLNMSYHQHSILPSNFLGDMFYYVTEEGHRAPLEKCEIIYDESKLVETLCSYDWIFMFSKDFEKQAKILHNIYGKTILKIKEDSTKIDSVWWRENMEPIRSILSTETYQHIWKGSKISIVDDLELANNLVLL